jgi:hypothetical protein
MVAPTSPAFDVSLRAGQGVNPTMAILVGGARKSRFFFAPKKLFKKHQFEKKKKLRTASETSERALSLM